MDLYFGLPEETRAVIAAGLQGVLADCYALLINLHRSHWNVEGPRFQPLHAVFEEFYDELFDGLDEVAERIRQLGFTPRASLAEFAAITRLPQRQDLKTEEDHITDLLQGNLLLVERMKPLISLAMERGDEVTGDLLIKRSGVHQKNCWLLAAYVQRSQPKA